MWLQVTLPVAHNYGGQGCACVSKVSKCLLELSGCDSLGMSALSASLASLQSKASFGPYIDNQIALLSCPVNHLAAAGVCCYLLWVLVGSAWC